MAQAKNTYRKNSPKAKKRKTERKKRNFKFFSDKRFLLSIGFFLIAASIFLMASFISYLFSGLEDQSIIISNSSGQEVSNESGTIGALVAHLFIYNWFGIAAFFIPPFIFLLGYYFIYKKQVIPLSRLFFFVTFVIIWLSTLMGFITLDPNGPEFFNVWAGGIGYTIAHTFNNWFGWTTFLLLILSLIVFIIYFFNVTQLVFGTKKGYLDNEHSDYSSERTISEEDVVSPVDNDHQVETEEWKILDESEINGKKPVRKEKSTQQEIELEVETPILDEREDSSASSALDPADIDKVKEHNLVIEQIEKEEQGKKIENYDPTLDLGSFQYPSLELLKDHGGDTNLVTKEELSSNKDKIVETLTNFKIGINSIKATIGPTVTLYEIVPEAGIKISKIKNLEDDIALSLSALGIRIIAPIPGKGTIGIEVPNKKRQMVSVKSVLSTEKFLKSEYDLPVILGKTISNEVYITDLTKMPHLLMAGATGQGKSVGLNVLLASLLYKKHPSQLKFVLVDPKRVELTLFNKIERHYLAKLPNSEEAIITEMKNVIYTLNSLCIEMDNRLLLLKDAGCRNLKEYNNKFVQRRLSPEKGHRYMPYIVLIIDELADLMVTAGKEVETPISRLAAVARAIGIHLVLATQRPSVNVITGVIKANFPARLSYRVTSKIDSRTILDMGGADQLVGMGDMLFSLGSELVRLQCPFIDTEEVDNLCEFIGNQRGYPSAYLLPEFIGDEESGAGEVDLSDRDNMFDEAARLIVRHQQGSTSLIQRKLKLGYNRAGRIIDQLEAAGIVGPFEGSKAREVLVTDEYSLEQLLNDLESKN